MKKLLIILMVIAMASFLFVGCFPVAPPIEPDDPLEPDEPGLYFIGIEVDPKTMDLIVGESDNIDSVTATYEVRVYEGPIALEDCLFLTSDSKVATVSSVGEVTAVKVGTADIIVSYRGETDTLEVTVVRSITINWLESARRYNALDGSFIQEWPAELIGPAILKCDNGGYYLTNIDEFFNDFMTEEMEPEGSLAIDETGLLTGWARYSLDGLLTENIFMGQVEIIVYEDGISGTMVGTYTQFKYAYAESDDEMSILSDNYPGAVGCAEEGKWFVQYTDYITYPL
ncbi:hypothetical protein ES705_07633 [subsurface metagenome]